MWQLIKHRKLLVFVVLFVIPTLLGGCSDPPIGTELIDNPTRYMTVNQYVRELREKFVEEKRITEGFLPSKLDTEKTTEYQYWYECALFGDPRYAITVTVQLPDEEALQKERNRIKQLEGFTENETEKWYLLESKDLGEKLTEFWEPPPSRAGALSLFTKAKNTNNPYPLAGL